MPELRGLSYETAREVLSYYGVYLRTDSSVTDAAGQVVSAQDIEPGELVEHGSVVTVTLVDADDSLLGEY